MHNFRVQRCNPVLIYRFNFSGKLTFKGVLVDTLWKVIINSRVLTDLRSEFWVSLSSIGESVKSQLPCTEIIKRIISQVCVR